MFNFEPFYDCTITTKPEFKGVEKRGDYWIVKVSYNENYLKPEVEKRLNETIDNIKLQLEAKAQ